MRFLRLRLLSNLRWWVFSSRSSSLDFIRKFFFNLKLIAEFSVTLLDTLHVLIKLSNDLDYSRVFCHRSYFVNNCFMKILHALGSMFGRPLKVDNAIFVGSRASVVRVLVELDITKKYSDKVWLGPIKFGYIQMVEMEDFPSLCDSCKCIEHVRGECSSHSSVLNIGPPIMSNSTPSDGNAIVNAFAALNTVDLDGNPPPPVQPSQGYGGVEMVLGCGEADVISDIGIQAVDLPLVTCGTELLSEHVLSTPLIVGAIASDNLVAADISAKPIDNLDPQSVGLDHPLDDMVDDVVARVSSPNDNVVSDANQIYLNAIIHVSLVASLGVQLSSHMEVFKRNELIFYVPISVIYNAELKAQLALTLNNDDPSDWLEDSFSSACRGAGGDLVDDVDELQEMYSLQVGHIVHGPSPMAVGSVVRENQRNNFVGARLAIHDGS
ncbi:hypothetical protein IEQ34_015962 [Dendrobium chrysotoxum]|uniref:Uncharacterized protein n=1 Tax=Dendrobium chrysotoxum TaxID=161865 RepID=A0AAV7GJE8_DENCH|nr:hypothetical protein IEQ34_015962 [Dendrobium chrysotoxum]